MSMIFIESRLAELTGVIQERWAKVRVKLRRGEDWDLVGNQVRYSAAGLDAALVRLGLAKKTAAGALEGLDGLEVAALRAEAVAPAASEAEQDLEVAVVRRFPMNPHLLECTLKGALILVRVRSQEHFLKGMEVPVRLPAGANVWELGRKAPRFQGRW